MKVKDFIKILQNEEPEMEIPDIKGVKREFRQKTEVVVNEHNVSLRVIGWETVLVIKYL